jgi:hypothetical protein
MGTDLAGRGRAAPKIGDEYFRRSALLGKVPSLPYVFNGRPGGPRVDSGARRAGGAARPRGCRVLLDGFAVEGHGRGHPRFPPAPFAGRPLQTSYARAFGPLLVPDKTSNQLCRRGKARSPPPVSPPRQARPSASSAAALPVAPAGFASLIVADFPALFTEFRGKRFALLSRGSRGGFGARDFHSRCDGYAPILTLIQDTEGNVFGGFKPVE